MISNILERLKQVYLEIRKTSIPTKIFVTSLIITSLTMSIIFIAGCYSPSKSFLERLEQRIDHHFPIYSSYIDTANKQQIEKATGKSLGNATKEEIDLLKEAYKKEIEALKIMIKENTKLLKGK